MPVTLARYRVRKAINWPRLASVTFDSPQVRIAVRSASAVFPKLFYYYF